MDNLHDETSCLLIFNSEEGGAIECHLVTVRQKSIRRGGHVMTRHG